MESIYILGSGGFAKEVYSLIKATKSFHVVAFIDYERKEPIQFREREVPVISEQDFLEKETKESAMLAIGVGDPSLIQKLTNKFHDFYFPNLIHPFAIIDLEEIELGVGNIITAGVIFTTNIKVQNYNIFNLSTTIGHDCVIGSYNVINPTVNISGGVIIGDANLLGVSSTILQYKRIGTNCIVGASSLVTKDVESNAIVIGVPAKIK